MNVSKIIRIVLVIIILSLVLDGVGRALPFLIILGLIGWGLYRSGILKQWLPRKKPMIDQTPEQVQEGINIPPQMQRQISKFAKFGGVIIVIVILLSITVAMVPAGHVGVIDFFGKVSDRELPPGLNFKTPFSRVVQFTTQTQDFTMTSKQGEGRVRGDDSITVLTKEGLNLTLDITVLYHLEKGNAATLYKNVGQNYEEKIIRPAIRSTIREVVAQYQAEALYSEKREEATNGILSLLKTKIAPRGIEIEDVLIRNVTLPLKLADAIEEKLKAEQESQRFDFVIEKETKEAERKRIEAAGQRDAQAIVSESLTVRYLEFLYLQELKEREGTIYVPTNPNNGLPLFRGL